MHVSKRHWIIKACFVIHSVFSDTKSDFFLPAHKILPFPLKFLEPVPPPPNFIDSLLPKFNNINFVCYSHVHYWIDNEHTVFPFSLDIHISCVGGEQQLPNPLSEYPRVCTDLKEVAKFLKTGQSVVTQ
jgi:hypothetical protein